MFAKLPTIFVKAIFANLWNYFLLKKLPKLVLSKKNYNTNYITDEDADEGCGCMVEGRG